MKFPIVLLFVFIIISLQDLYAKVVPISLENRVEKSELIIEGEVITSASSWNSSKTMIYTELQIKATKLFKGKAESIYKIVIPGGEVNNDKISLCPEINLNQGDLGIFFLVPAGNSVFPDDISGKYELYSWVQGYINCDLKANRAVGWDEKYQIYQQSLIPEIESIVGTKYRLIGAYREVKGSKSELRDMIQATISSITPSTLNGGAGDTLIIQGTGFGSTRGTVRFRNADNGGASYFNASSSAVYSWSDTLIKVRVPSRAGTGSVQIETNAGETATSSNNLTVRYAFLNANDTYRTYLVNYNGSGGYNFTFNTNLYSNQTAVNAFLRALQTWRCNIYVRFGLSSQTSNVSCPSSDGINILTMAGASCPLPDGVLAVTYSYWNSCSGSTQWYLREADLIVNPQFNWNWGPGAPAGNQFDAETVILHELGHALQLGHVVGNEYVMHYSVSFGSSKRSLNTWSDLAGGQNIMNASTSSGRCNYSAMQALNSSNCELSQYPEAEFTSDLQNGCGSLTVQFSDESTNNPNQWFWDINNDGITDYTSQNPVHTFTQPGTYSVRLIAANLIGRDTITKVNYIKVNHLPLADFNGSQEVCESNSMIYSSALISGYSFTWSVNGGTISGSSTSSSVNILWGAAGQGQLKLVVKNDTTSCKDSIIKNININPLPEVDFTGTNTVCELSEQIYTANFVLNLSNRWYATRGNIIGPDNGNTVLVKWGTGVNATLKLVQVNTITGCIDSITKNITINDLPNPAIDGSLTVCASNEYEYFAPNVPNISYDWTISNGDLQSTTNSKSIKVKWQDMISGSIKLKMTNNLTLCSDSVNEVITINPLPKPIIDGLNNACAYSNSTFSCEYYSGISYNWSVNGGSVQGSSSGNSVIVAWDKPGQGEIKLIQTVNATGCKDSAILQVNIHSLPDSDIQGDSKACLNSTHLYKTTKEQNATYIWTATNGLILNQNRTDSVLVKWHMAIPSSLKLIKRNTITGCTDSSTIAVNVIKFESSFLFGDTLACAYYPEEYFVSKKDTDLYDYEWDVKGGEIIEKSEPTTVRVIWFNTDSARITLVKTLGTGDCSEAITKKIRVLDNPKIEFSELKAICGNSEAFILDIAQPHGGIYSGPGIFENTLSPSKLTSGFYKLKYKLTNENGCISEDEKEFLILDYPKRPEISFNGKTLKSSYSGTNEWLINNIIINQENNTELIPTESGYYSVIAVSEDGCRSEQSDSIYVEITSVSSDSVLPSDLNIFPIPSSDVLNVEFRRNQDITDFKIKIFDLTGVEHLISNQTLHPSENLIRIPLPNISTGVYILHLESGSFILRKRIIIFK